MLDLGNRLHVADRRPRRAVRLDLHPVVDDLSRQPLDVVDDVGASPRQADIGGVDADAIKQVEDLNLLLDVNSFVTAASWCWTPRRHPKARAFRWWSPTGRRRRPRY